MNDPVPVSAETYLWLQRLARAHEQGDGWDDGPPVSGYVHLASIGVVERRPEAWRLTDIGWWTMNHVVLEGNGGE